MESSGSADGAERADAQRLVLAVLESSADTLLWAAMLSEDPVYERIPTAVRASAVERAAACGDRAAEECRTRHGTSDPPVIAAQLGIRVIHSEEPCTYGNLVQASTYSPRIQTITLYTRAIDEMNRFLADHDLAAPLGVPDVRPVCLAHEIFHHLEETSLGRAAGLIRVVVFRWGPLTRKSGIAQLGEIAADAFAKRLLTLPVAPRLLDYLTIWIHNPAAGRQRLANLMSAARA